MFEGFERKRVDCGEATINCVVAGNGPPVLLLHGFPQTWWEWRPVVEHLAQDFRVLMPDLRGLGFQVGELLDQAVDIERVDRLGVFGEPHVGHERRVLLAVANRQRWLG